MVTKQEGLAWLRDWRPILAALVIAGVAWGDLRTQQGYTIDRLDALSNIPERVTRLESSIEGHKARSAHGIANQRLSDLERRSIKTETLLNGVIDRLDRLLARGNIHRLPE